MGIYVVPITTTDTSGTYTVTPAAQNPSVASGESVSSSAPAQTQADAEAETDSPLDNANFLSFEDWKKQNLAKVGQSPENIGQGRGPVANKEGRRRPVNIDSTLDSIGEDVELEFDFGGFGSPGKSADDAAWTSAQQSIRPSDSPGSGDDNVPQRQRPRNKDAGKTCKERFNYASFDCAATILKTNKEAKSPSSILVENKDSYMLNECSASNKFLIIELCDDILVDTVVLANYEFFSSIFRTFRVSVSDRYPVKMERWKELGVFEARNSREIQAFLVQEPIIWARYLRIEFLTQYGSEFYCPVSLLRIHGTTMMEEFRHQEEAARGDDYDVEPIEEAAAEVVEAVTTNIKVQQAVSQDDQTPETITKMNEQKANLDRQVSSDHIDTGEGTVSSSSGADAPRDEAEPETDGVDSKSAQTWTDDAPRSYHTMHSSSRISNVTNIVSSQETVVKSYMDHQRPKKQSVSTANLSDSRSKESVYSTSTSQDSVSSVPPKSSDSSQGVSTSTTGQHQAQTQSQNTQAVPRTATSPPPANPTTQESFFKSIHKRLQALESNSTLSLQYIEEQSRILRDAFSKVEKRQLQKTEKFLQHINETVITELKGFRQMYDLLWQSTVMEVEGMRETHGREMLAVSERLSILAEEVVWQKRMAVVQSTLLLLCLALVLFTKSGVGGGLEVPVVQHMLSQSWARGVAGRMGLESPSPPTSPPRSGWGVVGLRGSRSEINLGHRRITSDTDGEGYESTHDFQDESRSPTQSISSPTEVMLTVEPPSPPPTELDSREPSMEPDAVTGTMSGPATPTGLNARRAHFDMDEDDINDTYQDVEATTNGVDERHHDFDPGSPSKEFSEVTVLEVNGHRHDSDAGENDESTIDGDNGGSGSSGPRESGLIDLDI